MKTTLKRIAAPKTWPLLRKAGKFVTRPRPNGHPLAFTLPLGVALRDMLRLVETDKQAKAVLQEHTIRVNGKRVYRPDDSIGFMDILSIGKENYLLTINNRGLLTFTPAKTPESTQKITGKTHLKGGGVQLNLMSGMNLLVKKDVYKTGDSVIVKAGKIVKHLAFGKGAEVIITGGSHIGTTGRIESVDDSVCTVQSEESSFHTTKENTYVLRA